MQPASVSIPVQSAMPLMYAQQPQHYPVPVPVSVQPVCVESAPPMPAFHQPINQEQEKEQGEISVAGEQEQEQEGVCVGQVIPESTLQ